MLSTLRILTAAAVLALAAFMMAMGYISLAFAPVMLVWNGSPLFAAYFISARGSRRAIPLSMLLFAISYVGVASLIYYQVFFRGAHHEMDGFAYLFVPFLGWFGLLCAQIDVVLDSWGQWLRGA